MSDPLCVKLAIRFSSLAVLRTVCKFKLVHLTHRFGKTHVKPHRFWLRARVRFLSDPEEISRKRMKVNSLFQDQVVGGQTNGAAGQAAAGGDGRFQQGSFVFRGGTSDDGQSRKQQGNVDSGNRLFSAVRGEMFLILGVGTVSDLVWWTTCLEILSDSNGCVPLHSNLVFFKPGKSLVLHAAWTGCVVFLVSDFLLRFNFHWRYVNCVCSSRMFPLVI